MFKTLIVCICVATLTVLDVRLTAVCFYLFIRNANYIQLYTWTCASCNKAKFKITFL